MKIVKNILLSSTALLLMTGMGISQSSTPQHPDATATPSRNSAMNMQGSPTGGVLTADRKFMDKAAQGGMAEVEMGQLAEQNGQSADVKAFGKRMVDDHTKANDQLKQLAEQKGVALPTSLDAKDQATKDRLSKLQGAAFDKAYMKDMVTDHKMDVAEFQRESKMAHDPDLKSWAGQTLPTLQSHLQQAEKISGSSGTAMEKNADNGMSAQGR